jgi:hypothetical protein
MFTALICIALSADPAVEVPHTVIHFKSQAAETSGNLQDPRRSKAAAPARSSSAKPAKVAPPTGRTALAGIDAARRLLGEDLELSQSRIEKYAVAMRFLALAERIEGNPQARWGAFCEASRLGVEAASPSAALATVDAAARFFEVDVPTAKLQALRECLSPPQTHARCPRCSLLPIAGAALAVSSEAEQGGDLETALALVEIAHAAALQGEDPQTCEAAQRRQEVLKRMLAGRQ